MSKVSQAGVDNLFSKLVVHNGTQALGMNDAAQGGVR